MLEAEQEKLASSFKLQNAQLSETTSEMDKLEDSYKQTSAQMQLTAKSVNNLEKQLQQAKSAYGENSKEAIRLEVQLNNAKTSVSKLANELDSIRKRKIDIQVQADLTGINKIKSAINNLPNEAKQAAGEIGQNLSAGAAVGVAGLGALTIGMDDTNKQLSRLESQAAAATSSVNKLGANTKKMSDADLANFEESLTIKENQLEKSLDSQLSAVEKNYDAQRDALEQKLDREYSATEKKFDKEESMLEKSLNSQYEKL